MVNGLKFGKLAKLDDLSKGWDSEPGSFTPWLAKSENLAILGEAIGIELELEAQEKEVGPFRADILCKDVATGHWVLIENQLTKTDHTHLGQLLTYASGLKAVTIVWVAKKFTDEHRATLDWLNEITDERFNFFGIEIELWKIDDSSIAPRLNVVCQPNDWSKEVSDAASRIADTDLTDAKRLQIEFWRFFKDYAVKNAKRIRPTKPLPQHWMNISLGNSAGNLCAVASTRSSVQETRESQEIGAEVILPGPDAKKYFNGLYEMKDEIEKSLGEKLIWRNPENKNMCRIFIRKTANLSDKNAWADHCKWLVEKLDRLHDVFGPRMRELRNEING